MCVHNGIQGNDCNQCLGTRVMATVGTSSIIGATGALVNRVSPIGYSPSIFSMMRNGSALRGNPTIFAASAITMFSMMGVNYAIGTTPALKKKGTEIGKKIIGNMSMEIDPGK